MNKFLPEILRQLHRQVALEVQILGLMYSTPSYGLCNSVEICKRYFITTCYNAILSICKELSIFFSHIRIFGLISYCVSSFCPHKKAEFNSMLHCTPILTKNYEVTMQIQRETWNTFLSYIEENRTRTSYKTYIYLSEKKWEKLGRQYFLKRYRHYKVS